MFRDLFDDIDNYSMDPDIFLDVPFVPTDEVVVDAMLNLAGVGPKDLLYDLGSGDGRILIAAAKDYDTRGIGVDIDPVRIGDAMEAAGWAGVEYLVDFVEEDIFTVDFSEATVVTLYLLETVNAQLRPRLLKLLRPGSRIVSHAFNMGDWKADETLKLGSTNIYKWIVPAEIAGVWEWTKADGKHYRIEVQQKYQEISGSAWLDGKQVQLINADLRGGRLELKIRDPQAASASRFTLNFVNRKLHSVIPEP